MSVSRPSVAEVIRRFAPEVALGARATLVLDRLRDCRTAALGGHRWRCEPCGHDRIAYNSCRDRHCPGCQGTQSRAWLDDRLDEVLPVPHFHAVFTLPGELRPLALGNPRALYNLLFTSAAETLRTIARDQKHLGAKIGFFGILHTWGGSLAYHPHVHFVVPGGGLSLDGERWVASRPRFLFSQRVLALLFRRLFLAALRLLAESGEIDLPPELRGPGRFDRLLGALRRKKWVVDLREPFSSPERVLEYLARYTHRVAIANGRLRRIDDDGVLFDAKDSRTGTVRPVRLTGAEFLRRFAMHILPRRFVRIRYYGLLAHRDRGKRLERCRHLIEEGGHAVAAAAPSAPATTTAPPGETDESDPIAVADSPRCPQCRGPMVRVAEIARSRLEAPSVRAPPVIA